jgi:hypothetical protein
MAVRTKNLKTALSNTMQLCGWCFLKIHLGEHFFRTAASKKKKPESRDSDQSINALDPQ